MARFCSRCGSLNDESTGLCPVCDREKLEAMRSPQRKVNFCAVCGTPIDQETGNCPNCTKPIEEVPAAEATVAVETTFVADEPMVEESSAEASEVVIETVAEEPETAVAVQETPVFEPIPIQEPAVAVEYKKRSGAGKVILTIFLSFLLFITSLLSVVVICVRYTTSQNTIQSVLEEIDYVEVLNNVLQTEEVVSGEFGDVTDTRSFSDNLCEYLEEEHGVENVDSKQIEEFIEESTIMDFISEKAAAYVSDIYSGSDDFDITVKDVEALVEDNAEVFEEHFGVTVTDNEVKKITEWLVDEEMLEEISTSAVKDDSSEIYYVLNIGFSYFTLVILLVLVLLCLVGMGLVDWSKGAMGAGIVFTIIGGLFTAVALVLAGLPALLSSFIGENFISDIVMKVLSANLVVFASVLGLGVLLLVIRCVVRRLVRRSRRAKVA